MSIFHEVSHLKVSDSLSRRAQLVIFWVQDSMDWWNMMEPIANQRSNMLRLFQNCLKPPRNHPALMLKFLENPWSPPCDDQQSLCSELFVHVFASLLIPYSSILYPLSIHYLSMIYPLCVPYYIIISILYPLFIHYLSMIYPWFKSI